MPEKIYLNNPGQPHAPRAKARHFEPSDVFADALRKRMNTTYTRKNEELFSELLTRLAKAERGNAD